MIAIFLLILISAYAFGITLRMLIAEPKVKYTTDISIWFILDWEYYLWNWYRFVSTKKKFRYWNLYIWNRKLSETETYSLLEMNKNNI